MPVLSALYASTAGMAARTLALAAELFARSLNERYEGIAIASRMPRMMMTTRSSMRVKPLSSPAKRCRILLDIRGAPSMGTNGVARTASALSPSVGNPRWSDRRTSVNERGIGAFRPVKEPRRAADSSFEAHAALLFHRRFARADGRAQRVRPARDPAFAAGDPRARVDRAPGRLRAADGRGHPAAALSDPLERAPEAARDQAAARFLAFDPRARAVSRQRLLPEGIDRRRVPPHSRRAEDARGARDPGHVAPACRKAARDRSDHRADRLR